MKVIKRKGLIEMTVIRNLLFKFSGVTKIFGDLEIRFLQNVSFTAGKLYVVARNIK